MRNGKHEEGWDRIRDALEQGETPRIEMHWDTERIRGKDKTWWIRFTIYYSDQTEEGHVLHREVGKIPAPGEHEAEHTKLQAAAAAISMLFKRCH